MRFLLTLSLLFAMPSTLLGSSKHSSVSAETNGNSAIFKVVPANNMVVNYEGPWSLKITNANGATTQKTVLGRGDVNKEIPGFNVSLSEKNKSGEITYKMTAFVCTKDKTNCFRDVHEGTLRW